jgi:hypothetical protein
MTEGPRPDAGDVLARVGHHWRSLMAFGAMETTLAVRSMSFHRRYSGARTTAHAT